jgi:hypothetical protein
MVETVRPRERGQSWFCGLVSQQWLSAVIDDDAEFKKFIKKMVVTS